MSALARSRRNIIAARRGHTLSAGPFMAELDVTYRCNCRCEMCQRWQDTRTGELSLSEYETLAQVFSELGVHLVSIAGGEPLLREDIFSIIDAFFCRGMVVNLCTNGTLLGQYADVLCRSEAACITVSVDGATAATHDDMRGAGGSFDEITRGIEAVMARSRSKRPLVRVRLTIANRNLHEVRTFYEQWKEKADDVLLQPVHHCRDSYYNGLDGEELRIEPDRLEKELEGTPLGRNGYLRRLIESLREDNAYPQHRCYAGVLMARIDPWGTVYPCLEQHVRVGSIREKDFRSVWCSTAFERERTRLAADNDCRCWYNNTAMISYYGKLLYCTTASGLREAGRSLREAKGKTRVSRFSATDRP
jgi:AdoMet-dependent heme synthase